MMKQKKSRDPIYAAQTILARRDHAEAEVRTKLARKAFTPAEIESAITWLKKQHLIDDEAFIGSYIESVLGIKAVGPRWLKFKLRQKGLPAGAINRILAEVYTREREQEIMETAIEQWKNSHQRYQDDKQRLTRFLLSRGFSSLFS